MNKAVDDVICALAGTAIAGTVVFQTMTACEQTPPEPSGLMDAPQEQPQPAKPTPRSQGFSTY